MGNVRGWVLARVYLTPRPSLHQKSGGEVPSPRVERGFRGEVYRKPVTTLTCKFAYAYDRTLKTADHSVIY